MTIEERERQVRDHFSGWSDTAITMPGPKGQQLTDAAVSRIASLINIAVEDALSSTQTGQPNG